MDQKPFDLDKATELEKWQFIAQQREVLIQLQAQLFQVQNNIAATLSTMPKPEPESK